MPLIPLLDEDCPPTPPKRLLPRRTPPGSPLSPLERTVAKTAITPVASYVLMVIMIAMTVIFGVSVFFPPFAGRYEEATPRISNSKVRPTELRFIGERHSGTKWMFHHLADCFSHSIVVKPQLSRWKHWFQYDSSDIHNVLVVAQFRNPYDWVESMRLKPYHSPNHIKLDWQDFVTRPWTMPLPPSPHNISTINTTTCLQGFTPAEIVPCPDIRDFRDPRGHPMPPRYELRRDLSGSPYDSIVDLRRDKIHNFFEVQNYTGVSDWMMVRYEDAVLQGTSELLKDIEERLGIEARCEPLLPQEPKASNDRELQNDFIQWMNEHVDWEAEQMVGYSKWEISN